MKLNHHDRIRRAEETYNNCTNGKWVGAFESQLQTLEGFAAQAIEYARNEQWDEALRWEKRCVEMEKRIGFNTAPIWSEFGETIEKICGEISQSDST